MHGTSQCCYLVPWQCKAPHTTGWGLRTTTLGPAESHGPVSSHGQRTWAHGQLLRDSPAGILSSSCVQYPPMNLFSTNFIYLELIYSSVFHNILCNKFHELILCSKKRYQLVFGLNVLCLVNTPLAFLIVPQPFFLCHSQFTSCYCISPSHLLSCIMNSKLFSSSACRRCPTSINSLTA